MHATFHVQADCYRKPEPKDHHVFLRDSSMHEKQVQLQSKITMCSLRQYLALEPCLTVPWAICLSVIAR